MTTLPKFQDARTRTIWVQAALRQKGLSFAKIAQAHGWGRGTMARTMFTPSDAQEKAIAAALGVSQQELFPERYDAEGNRFHLIRENKARAQPCNVKKGEAA